MDLLSIELSARPALAPSMEPPGSDLTIDLRQFGLQRFTSRLLADAVVIRPVPVRIVLGGAVAVPPLHHAANVGVDGHHAWQPG